MKGYKHLTPAQQAQVLTTYQQMFDTTATAQAVGVTAAQVRTLLRKQGIKPPGGRRGACREHVAEVRQWAAEGVALSEIARRIGTTHHAVSDFLQQHHIPYQPFVQAGPNNPFWRGGRVVDKDGYILVKCDAHPHCDRHGYVREHRLVMEQTLGRYLTPQEVVHHRDGNKANNAPENLEMYGSNGQHLAETRQGQVPKWSAGGKRRIQESAHRTATRLQRSSRGHLLPDDPAS